MIWLKETPGLTDRSRALFPAVDPVPTPVGFGNEKLLSADSTASVENELEGAFDEFQKFPPVPAGIIA
jgi:hypothetical protein